MPPHWRRAIASRTRGVGVTKGDLPLYASPQVLLDQTSNSSPSTGVGLTNSSCFATGRATLTKDAFRIPLRNGAVRLSVSCWLKVDVVFRSLRDVARMICAFRNYLFERLVRSSVVWGSEASERIRVIAVDARKF